MNCNVDFILQSKILILAGGSCQKLGGPKTECSFTITPCILVSWSGLFTSYGAECSPTNNTYEVWCGVLICACEITLQKEK